MTFLNDSCAMQTWFSYVRRQKTYSYALFSRLKFGRRKRIKIKQKEKGQFFPHLLTRIKLSEKSA